jgi:hypothetical protein
MLRAAAAGNAPPALAQGQLAVDALSDPPRLYTGVPTSRDPSGRIDLLGTFLPIHNPIWTGVLRGSTIAGGGTWNELLIDASTTSFMRTDLGVHSNVLIGAVHCAAIVFQAVPGQTANIGGVGSTFHTSGGFAVGTTYYATATAYNDMRLNPGRFEFYVNSGLTINQTFVPELRARIDGAGLHLPAGSIITVGGTQVYP